MTNKEAISKLPVKTTIAIVALAEVIWWVSGRMVLVKDAVVVAVVVVMAIVFWHSIVRGYKGKKLSEAEVAGQFVMSILKPIQQEWPQIAAELARKLQLKQPISSDRHATFEFAIAVIALQIQALPNLLPAAQADRIREHVIQCISSPDHGAYPREAIQEYQSAWSQSLQEREPPFDSIASVLFDKLGCQSSVELGNAKFKDPLLLMALSEKVITFGGAWWKNAIRRYTLVP